MPTLFRRAREPLTSLFCRMFSLRRDPQTTRTAGVPTASYCRDTLTLLHGLLVLPVLIMACVCAPPVNGAEPFPSFFEEEVARFAELAESGIPEYQIAAAQGFYYLEHPRGEPHLLRLIDHPDPAVRVQVVKALGRCGGRESVAALIETLADRDWEVRCHARDGLARMTAVELFANEEAGLAWLEGSTWPEKESVLIEQLASDDMDRALAALEALRFVGTPAAEEAVIAQGARRGRVGLQLTVRALERLGTKESLPALRLLCKSIPSACWAATEIAGPQAEADLLQVLPRWRNSRLDCLINLDRIESTKCEPHIPLLLHAFGLVIFRSRTDDLQFGPTAYQRVAANLIRRTGKSQEIVDLILAECENRRRDEDTPAAWRSVLSNMRKELEPGFVRNDGATVAQPLAALPHIIRDARFVPRLIALLDHPAYIVRIYAAESLGALKAAEGVAPILTVVQTPYPFPDPTSQVSGKHFDKSKFVRWRGYLCIALGKLGNDEARLGLEQLAANSQAYRDVRYGAVVGLRFLASAASLPVLQKVAQDDIIHEIRYEAEQAMHDIELKVEYRTRKSEG